MFLIVVGRFYYFLKPNNNVNTTLGYRRSPTGCRKASRLEVVKHRGGGREKVCIYLLCVKTRRYRGSVCPLLHRPHPPNLSVLTPPVAGVPRNGICRPFSRRVRSCLTRPRGKTPSLNARAIRRTEGYPNITSKLSWQKVA